MAFFMSYMNIDADFLAVFYPCLSIPAIAFDLPEESPIVSVHFGLLTLVRLIVNQLYEAPIAELFLPIGPGTRENVCMTVNA